MGAVVQRVREFVYEHFLVEAAHAAGLRKAHPVDAIQLAVSGGNAGDARYCSPAGTRIRDALLVLGIGYRGSKRGPGIPPDDDRIIDGVVRGRGTVIVGEVGAGSALVNLAEIKIRGVWVVFEGRHYFIGVSKEAPGVEIFDTISGDVNTFGKEYCLYLEWVGTMPRHLVVKVG